MNNSLEDSFNDNRTTSEIIEIVYHAIAIAVGIPINIWACLRYWNIWKNKPNNRRLVILGVNLTVANILILIYSPAQIIWLWNIYWDLGNPSCRLMMFAKVFSHHLSSNSTVLIALDMFRVLRSPLNQIRKSEKDSVLFPILCSTVIAGACSVPQLFTWSLFEIPGTNNKMQCMFSLVDDLTFTIGYQIFHLLAVFYVPLLLIIICYVGSGWYTWKSLQLRKQLQGNLMHKYIITPELQRSASRISLRKNGKIKRKLFLVSAAVILTYVFSWLPYQAISLWDASFRLHEGNASANDQNFWLERIIWLEALQICGSCINPVLYTFHGL